MNKTTKKRRAQEAIKEAKKSLAEIDSLKRRVRKARGVKYVEGIAAAHILVILSKTIKDINPLYTFDK